MWCIFINNELGQLLLDCVHYFTRLFKFVHDDGKSVKNGKYYKVNFQNLTAVTLKNLFKLMKLTFIIFNFGSQTKNG